MAIQHFGTPFNVVAAFQAPAQAHAAVDALQRHGVPASAIHLNERTTALGGDAVAGLRAEMQEELVESWGSPVVYMTGPQARGAFWGTVLFTVPGFVLGAAAGAVWALVDGSALGWWGQILVVALLGAMCGGTIGFLVGGGLEPRHEAASDPERTLDDKRAVAERDVLLAIHTSDQDVAERAADVLRGMGAERVDLVDGHGVPLPPQADHPRPADPEGWWWRRAGQG